MTDEKLPGSEMTYDELISMAKTHPRTAIVMAHGEGLLYGMRRVKEKLDPLVLELQKVAKQLDEDIPDEDPYKTSIKQLLELIGPNEKDVN